MRNVEIKYLVSHVNDMDGSMGAHLGVVGGTLIEIKVSVFSVTSICRPQLSTL